MQIRRSSLSSNKKKINKTVFLSWMENKHPMEYRTKLCIVYPWDLTIIWNAFPTKKQIIDPEYHFPRMCLTWLGTTGDTDSRDTTCNSHDWNSTRDLMTLSLLKLSVVCNFLIRTHIMTSIVDKTSHTFKLHPTEALRCERARSWTVNRRARSRERATA